jgi:hypothetical protein
MDKLKLFIVGESSPNPDEWNSWGAHAIVVAHDATEAESLAEGCCGPATEIPMDAPVCLAFDSAWEPDERD